MYGWRMRIGLLLPSPNTVMEAEFYRMAPNGVTIHSTRIKCNGSLSEQTLIDMTKDIEACSLKLADCDVDIIVFGCTSGSFVKGVGYDIMLSKRIEKATGIPALTTSTAVVEALKSQKIEKVVLITPYTKEINEKAKNFLEGHGFYVVNIKSLGLQNSAEIGRQEPYVTYRLAKQAYTKEADGVFISCTNFRTIEIIEPLEKDIAKPVVTANQATMAEILKKGKIGGVSGYGRLLSGV